MKTFLVVVHSTFIKISDWQTKSRKQADAIAMIDGRRCRYFISRHGHTDKSSQWRERGMMQLHCHARNSGKIIGWLPVGHVVQSRKKEQSDKQLQLL